MPLAGASRPADSGVTAVVSYAQKMVADAVQRASKQGQAKVVQECMSVMTEVVKEAEEKAGLVLADVQTRVSGLLQPLRA